jgi:chromosomal replication initiation ATPase DnaA
MKIICSYFNITEETLYNSKSKGDVYTAKVIAFKIMNNTLGVSASDIGKKFNRYQNSVSYAIKKFNALEPRKKAQDRKVMDDYIEIMLEVKKYTNSKIIE